MLSPLNHCPPSQAAPTRTPPCKAFVKQVLFLVASKRPPLTPTPAWQVGALVLMRPMIYLLLEADYGLARRLIREIMQLGYDAVWTQHPEDAQRLLQQQPFDLVILSLSAVDPLAQQILISLGNQGLKTPFVVLLANERPEDRALVLRLGAAACLSKPLAPWSLRGRLRGIIQGIRKREKPESTPFQQAVDRPRGRMA